MNILFYGNKIQVDYSLHDKKEPTIYLDESVLDKLNLPKPFDEESLKEYGFKMFLKSDTKVLCWEISSPVYITKYLKRTSIPEEHGVLAQPCPRICGEVVVEKNDGQETYICKYDVNYLC